MPFFWDAILNWSSWRENPPKLKTKKPKLPAIGVIVREINIFDPAWLQPKLNEAIAEIEAERTVLWMYPTVMGNVAHVIFVVSPAMPKDSS